LLREVDQGIENAEIAFSKRDLERLHVKPITGQNTLGVAPLGVRGGTAAARLGFIDDVVVNQSRGMYDFDDRGKLDRTFTLISEELSREFQ
jgi:hypothetical protein